MAATDQQPGRRPGDVDARGGDLAGVILNMIYERSDGTIALERPVVLGTLLMFRLVVSGGVMRFTAGLEPQGGLPTVLSHFLICLLGGVPPRPVPQLRGTERRQEHGTAPFGSAPGGVGRARRLHRCGGAPRLLLGPRPGMDENQRWRSHWADAPITPPRLQRPAVMRRACPVAEFPDADRPARPAIGRNCMPPRKARLN